MAKDTFSLDEMLSTANALKYQREIRNVLEAQLENPDEELVKFLHARVGTGRFVQSAKEQFTPLVQKAFAQLVRDRVSERLRSALATEGIRADVPASAAPPALAMGSEEPPSKPAPNPDIHTTEDELEGFRIVRAITCGVLPAERITYRDAKTYFAILVDDNNRKPICRLWFNTSQWYLGLLDSEKKETRHPISSAVDLYNFANELRAAAAQYADLLQSRATEVAMNCYERRCHASLSTMGDTARLRFPTLIIGRRSLQPSPAAERAKPRTGCLRATFPLSRVQTPWRAEAPR